MTNVILFFLKEVKLQGQGHKKNNGTHGMVSSLGSLL